MPYKITKNEAKKLQKAIKSANAKLARGIKKDPSMIYFYPAKFSMKDERGKIDSKAAFNRRLKSIQAVMEKDSLTPIITPGGVATTAYEIKELKKANALINRRRKEKLKKLPKNLEYYGTMGAVERNVLKPRKFNALNVNQKSFDKFKKALEEQIKEDYFDKRDTLYYNNYKQTAIKELGPYAEIINALLDLLQPSEVAKAYYTNPLLDIKYVYPVAENDSSEIEELASILENEWLEEIKDAYRNSGTQRREIIREYLSSHNYNISWKNWNRMKPK